ncbi:hypothetical protein Cni_G20008 [Canna indica]|uniref:Uncharacterized protein n=1 Tax=Canna indica TaxID=4628 RepID=A0AAQ3KSF2_9LILI|nr:hypothetical protein Cni_G20008 [Canna indica]
MGFLISSLRPSSLPLCSQVHDAAKAYGTSGPRARVSSFLLAYAAVVIDAAFTSYGLRIRPSEIVLLLYRSSPPPLRAFSLFSMDLS